MRYIHGIHDPGGEHLMETRPGWIVFTEAIGADPADLSGRDYSPWSARGFGVLVRLNHGYGSAGTIPAPEKYRDFAQRVRNFVLGSRGDVAGWIIGNEPNHSQERPGGKSISPELYAECFRTVARNLSAREATLIPAAVAPWNVETGDWLAYWERMLEALSGYAGGLALHTYTHGHRVELVTSEARMGAPFQDRRFEFRAYRDFLARVPEAMRRLPVYITEANQDEPWLDANNGWVQAAYLEIDRWNQTQGTQKVHCLCLYRWPDYDRWGMVNKRRVHDGFRQAVDAGYRVPATEGEGVPPQPAPVAHTVHLPAVVSTPATPTPTPSPQRDWDERLTARGVRIETPPLSPGQAYYRVASGRWLDVAESGGRHHILADVLSEGGLRMTGVPLMVRWPGGGATIVTQAKPGEAWAADFPLSPSRNEFNVIVADGEFPSERVTGIGMGADLGGGFNAAEHTSTALVWQVAVHGESQPAPEPPAPEPTPVRVTVPPLMHPLWPGAPVTQRFGVNAAVYARFGLDGHNGLDFGVPTGTPVSAVDGGRVAEVANDATGYGLYVKLVHPWGESLYGHLSRQSVAVGDVVAAGRTVGLSGNTGFSTGPHLHLGVRVNPYSRGRPFDGYSDPEPLLTGVGPKHDPDPSHADVVWALLDAATEFNVRPALLGSLAWAESSWRPDARSQAGAMGLCQIMPATWAEWSVKVGATDPWSARDNARVGAAYLAWLLKTLRGDVTAALIAYVWGIGNVTAGRPAPGEVVLYAAKIVHGADFGERWAA